MPNQNNSLSHTKWMCKYHIVFTPKYRREAIYGQIIRQLCNYKGVEIIEGHLMPDHVHILVGQMSSFKFLFFGWLFASQKTGFSGFRYRFIPSLRFGTGYASPYNPCHCLKLKNSKLNLVSIPPKYSVSQFMGYLKGKSSLMIFDKHANLKYKFGNRHFWAEGYYVSTVGLNEATIAKYIREQEAHDIAMDKITEKEYEDPFKGSK